MNAGSPSVCRVMVFWCLVVLGLLYAPVAVAQGFFRVSPGPLNEGHSAYDNSAGCPKCHASGEGVTNGRCLSCHGAVTHKGGLHNTFGAKPCIQCHKEHKGRAFNIIEWGSVGGKDSFNHELTGFSLKNHHGDVACTQCHVRRLKTGRVSYLGLSRDCQSCHKGVHGFTEASLRQNCETCHKSGRSLKGMVLRDWPAHASFAKTQLDGKHSAQTCTSCHKGGNMASRASPRKCAECHEASHPESGPVQGCANCHPQSGTFKGAKIDHNKFGFALTGQHAKASCAACHRRGSNAKTAGKAASKACVSCHQATHPVPGKLAYCASCHPSGGSFKGAKIDHSKYGLPLLGAHQKKGCASCHKGQSKLSYKEGACSSCHTHKKAHQGQFKDVSCSKCHLEGGTRTTPFDHNLDTKFKLDGYHAEAKVKDNCEACHPKKLYRTGKLNCVDCHKDKHLGELGANCTMCHATNLHFNAGRSKDFPHEKFPLIGTHKTTDCVACHVGGNYKFGKKTCYDCHAKDDKHQGKLGKDCGKCHEPVKGAPKFNHERMTAYPLKGAHKQTECAKCHQAKSTQTKALDVAAWKRTKAKALDLTFPVLGKKCIDCHSDPHQGRYGDACSACHSTMSFERITGGSAKGMRPKDHGGSWLRKHTTLPQNDGEVGAEKRACASCHGAPSCTNCHRTREPKSHTGLWRLRTHGKAASFDSEGCRTCHSAASCNQCHRRTPPMNHRGAWPRLHGYASGGFGDSNCFVCHKRADCARCHR